MFPGKGGTCLYQTATRCRLYRAGISQGEVNPLNAELNPICHLLELLGAHHIIHVSRMRVNGLQAEHFSCSSGCRDCCIGDLQLVAVSGR